ncbi:hypothetical protein BH24ACT5_BH24ACT5_26630 [soil metagenome]
MSGDQDWPSDDDADGVVASFAPVLRNEATWSDPPAGLLDDIIAAHRQEPDDDAEMPAGVSHPQSGGAAHRRLTGLRRWRLLATAAAIAAAFAAGMFAADGGNNAERPVAARVAMTGTDLMPGAAATGEISDPGAGFAIRLQVTGLEPAPSGTYYEGWVQSPAGDVVSVGTFHMWGGDGLVVLWAGVSLDDYPDLVVTRQVERASAEDRGFDAEDVVLQGPVVEAVN